MYNRRLVFAAACLGMLVFGMVATVIGSILPEVVERFGLDKVAAGSLVSMMSVGVLCGSLAFGPVVDRFGYRWLLAGCAALVATGLAGIALAAELWPVRLAAFAIGAGGGALNGATSALVSDISTGGRGAGLSVLGIFFGVGASGVPLVIGSLLDHFAYATLVSALGVLVLLPLVFFLVVRYPAPKHAQGFPMADALRLLREPPLLLLGLLMFLQSGMETSLGGWISTYAGEVIGLASGRAVYFVSLFWGGLMVARVVLGVVLRESSPARGLKVSLALAFVASLVMVAAHTPWLAATGVFLLGAGLSASFPVFMGYAGDRYPHLSGTAFGLLLVISLVGGSTMPMATGWIGAGAGMRLAFLFVPACLLLMFALFAGVAERRLHAPARAAR